jgi:hypothetical protein
MIKVPDQYTNKYDMQIDCRFCGNKKSKTFILDEGSKMYRRLGLWECRKCKRQGLIIYEEQKPIPQMTW